MINTVLFFYGFMLHSSELSLKIVTEKKYLGIFKLDQSFKTICLTMGESFI